MITLQGILFVPLAGMNMDVGFEQFKLKNNYLTEAPCSNDNENSQLVLFNSATALFLSPLSVSILRM
jgi:hypothetical protein